MSDWKGRAYVAVGLLVVLTLVLAGLGSAKSNAPKTLTVAWVSDISGPFASYNGSQTEAAAQAAIDAANAKGGVNGYQIKMKVYDAASSPATGVSVVRRAINDKVFALMTTSGSLDGALNLLQQAKIPSFAPGDSPSWIGKTHSYLFPYEGNLSTQQTTAWFDYCAKNGRKKIALAGGTSVGTQLYLDTWTKTIKTIPGTTVPLSKAGVDASNAASIQAFAQQLINSGANCIVEIIGGGDVQLQAAINQLGGDIWVVSPSSYGPSIEKQFGKSADNFIYANFFASLNKTSNKGVAEYLADMKKYSPKQDPYGFWVKGYAAARWFLYNLGRVKGTPTQAKIAAVANNTNGYNVDGLVPPIYFPSFHTNGQLCLGYSQLKDGKWGPVSGTDKNGYICGKRYG